MITAIRFNKYHITNGKHKIKCGYFSGRNPDTGLDYVAVHTYKGEPTLAEMFLIVYDRRIDLTKAANDPSQVIIYDGHPLFEEAMERYEKNMKDLRAKDRARLQKQIDKARLKR